MEFLVAVRVLGSVLIIKRLADSSSMSRLASAESSMPTALQDLPTIVLVQGLLQISEVYSKSVRGLLAEGYLAIQPQLPSCLDMDRPKFPQLSFIDDALAIRSELNRHVE